MVPTALPRSYRGPHGDSGWRQTVTLQSGEKKEDPTQETNAVVKGYHYMKSGKDTQKASQYIIDNILVWGVVNYY